MPNDRIAEVTSVPAGIPASEPLSTPKPGPPADEAPRFLAAIREALTGSSIQVRILLAIFVLGILVTVYVWSGRVSTDDAQVDAHITAVSSQVSGYVVTLPIDDNLDVQAGATLLQIDPREYKAKFDQAQAALDASEVSARSAELEIGLTRGIATHNTGSALAQHESDAAEYQMSQAQLERTANANLLEAEAEVAAKQATNERAQSDLERYRPLLATNDVSKFQLDAVEATARVAKSELTGAEQKLAAARTDVEIARATTNAAKAKVDRSQSLVMESKARERQVPIAEAAYKAALAAVERAKAERDEAMLELGYSTIKAPVTGRVTQMTVHLGQYVSPGNLLLTLVPLDKVYVTANFKETQMGHVQTGQHVKIHVDTYGRDFDGVVDSIAGAAGSRQALLPPQNATGNFIKVVQRLPVKIRVEQSADPRFILRPGMNVEATIYTR